MLSLACFVFALYTQREPQHPPSIPYRYYRWHVSVFLYTQAARTTATFPLLRTDIIVGMLRCFVLSLHAAFAWERVATTRGRHLEKLRREWVVMTRLSGERHT